MATTGRPRIEIRWEEVDKLCALHCTGDEIAAFFNCTYDTLQNRCLEEKEMRFSDYFKQKSGAGKISLRRRQYEMAKHSCAMAIWLGKQWLGQTEKMISVNADSAVLLKYNLDELGNLNTDAK